MSRKIDQPTLAALQARVEELLQERVEHARTVDALRQSRLLLEGIFHAIPVRVFWKDRNLVYLGCNEAFAHDAALAAPSEIVGKDDFQMVWRDQAELYRDDDRRVIESGLPRLLIEEPQTTPDGEILTLLTSKLPLRDAKGEIIGVLGTYMDITHRKRVEEELERERVRLNQALDQVDVLRGILPICARCKKIRDDTGYWNQVEQYVSEHSRAEFSHSICPECARVLYPEFSEAELADPHPPTERA
ncbi:MAG: PAS domain-containing protein [Gemmatimonadaceae bacterium]|nr:PAS domain-containing protein [Gemmatimonadaceae bacterium]